LLFLLNFKIFSGFSRDFLALSEQVKLYLAHLFQPNAYTAGFFLRGIYFTGADLAADIQAENTPHLWPILPWKKSEKSPKNRIKQVFVTDLIIQKIFCEKNLSRFVAGSNDSAIYTKFIQTLVLILGLFGGFYLVNSYYKLSETMRSLHPNVAKIAQMLEERKKISANVDDETFVQEAQILLSTIVNVVQTDLRFFFIPSSWISNLHYKLFALLENSNDLIIVKAIAKKIEEKYVELAKFEINDFVADQSNLKNPLEHHTFRTLHEFSMKFIELEMLQKKFVSATENGNTESFAWLVKKLIGIDLPKKFYKESTFFSNSLKANSIEIPNVEIHREQIKKRLEILFDRFINHAFLLRNFVSDFAELNKTLLNLEINGNHVGISNLRVLQNEVANIITYANGQEFQWLQHDSFKITLFLELLHHMENSTLLDPGFIQKLNFEITHKFLELKREMSGMKVAVIGNIFYEDGSKLLKVTDSIIELQGMLNTIFAEPFMQPYDDAVLNAEVEYGKTILWNIDKLNEINDIFASYDLFLAKKLPKYPAHLVTMLRFATKDNLNKLVRSKLSQARQAISSDFTSASVITISENIRDSFSPLNAILRRCKDLNLITFNAVKDIEKARALTVIGHMSQLLDSENLYNLECPEIALDNLTKSTSYFGRSMSEYLSSQKVRIVHFAKDVIEPVVKTLAMIDGFDSQTMNDEIRKWSSIVSDVNAYSFDPKSSNLYKLENFVLSVENLTAENLHKIVSDGNLSSKSGNFFTDKLLEIKQKLAVKIGAFSKDVVANHYARAFGFVRANKAYFPFNLDGQNGGVEVYNEFDQLVQNQSSTVEILKQIDPKFKAKNLQFIESLEKANKLMYFVNKPGAVMILSIQNPNDFSESFEKNLDYLVSASAVASSVAVNFPDSGQLKVTDRIEFRFRLAAQTGIVFLKMREYVGSGTEIRFVLSKKDLVKMLLKNTIVKNGQMVLKFEMPIMDALGHRKVLIFAVPIEISIENLPLILGEQSFECLMKGVK